MIINFQHYQAMKPEQKSPTKEQQIETQNKALKIKQLERKAKIRQWYRYPAIKDNAIKHRDAFKLGAEKEQRGERCPCCSQHKVEKDFPLGCPPFCTLFPQPQPQSGRQLNQKIPHLYLYFTFLKGLIIFLAFRFLIYDMVTIAHSVYGSYCSDIFKNGKGRCTYTLSAYNLKGQTSAGLHLDVINAIFTLLSILYFVRLRTWILQAKKKLQGDIIEEDAYSLLVTKIPSFTVQNIDHRVGFFKMFWKLKDRINVYQVPPAIGSEIIMIVAEFAEKQRKPKQVQSDQKACYDEIQRVFVEKIQELVGQSVDNMIDQYQYLRINVGEQLFSTNSKQSQQDFKLNIKYDQRYRRERRQFKQILDGHLEKMDLGPIGSQIKDYVKYKLEHITLLDYVDMEIVTGASLCYDLNAINTLNNHRNSIQFLTYSNDRPSNYKSNFIRGFAQKCNTLEMKLQKQFQEPLGQLFHTSHFIGKAIVTFEYCFYRDLILKQYELNPTSFKMNGEPIMIEPAPKPTDIIWQNMSESQENRKKYIQHSWVVMVMMLVLSFAAFVGLQLFARSFEVVVAKETPWQKFQRNAISLTSALVVTLINKFLGYQIDVLVSMEKHSTKINRQDSLIIKSVLAQSFNSLFIYMIIYAIHPDNPLGPYGLAEKATSLAIMSNLTTLLLQIFRPNILWNDMKTKFTSFQAKQESEQDAQQNGVKVEKVPKFQIQLNREYQYPKFDQQGMYVSYILMVFLVSFYGYLVPVTTPIVLGFFILLYWVDKYNAFKRSSLDSFDDSRGDLIFAIIQISVFLSAFSYFIWDLSIQQEPRVKPLNLLCIFLALEFVGFEVINSSEVKAKLFSNDETSSKSKQSYYNMLKKSVKTYKSESIATKYFLEKGREAPIQRHSREQGSNEFQKQVIQLMKVNKFEKGYLTQCKQVKSTICPGCRSQKNIIKNFFCQHSVCVFCFWTNIYCKIETLCPVNCFFCDRYIDETLYVPQLESRLRQKVRYTKLTNYDNKICMNCFANYKNAPVKEEVVPEQTKTLPIYMQLGNLCQTCQKQYCAGCRFEKHDGKQCVAVVQDKPKLHQCWDCKLIVLATDMCYGHLPGARLQRHCPVCILGWSDIYNHNCKNQKADSSSSFVSFLKGALNILRLLGTCVLAVAMVGLYLVAMAVAIGVSPVVYVFFFVVVIINREWIAIVYLTVLLPYVAYMYLSYISTEFYAYTFQRVDQESYSHVPNGIANFIYQIPELPLIIKNYFYQFQPYKMDISKYTEMKIDSNKQRIAYFFLMLLLMPIMFPLALLYFIGSALVVLCFTLVFLPYIISKEKRVSLWIPTLFYPVMLFYYFAPLFGSYLRNHLIDFVVFYANYTKTMLCYLICCPRSNSNEGTSLQEERPEQADSK